jgi:hypothetical protein
MFCRGSDVEKVVEEAIQHDHESSESTVIETDYSSCPNEVTMTPYRNNQ